MSLSDVFLPFFVYLLPMLSLYYIGVDILLRNPKKVEHRLVSLTITCYFLLFLEEYIRYQLPLEYSAQLSALWFASAGVAIPGLTFHFVAKFTGLDKRMSRWLYPYVFHLPLLIIPVNLLSGQGLISSQEFIVSGAWKLPVYNVPYYAAITACFSVCIIPLVLLFKGRRGAVSPEHRAVYNLLIVGVSVTYAWVLIFGFFDYGAWLPPFPYIYGGIVWCLMLRLTMKKYDFLNFNKQKYEKLFNLNPAAILLIDMSGLVKEANPSARQLFNQAGLDHTGLAAWAGQELKDRLSSRQDIKELETTIQNGDKREEVLIDGDYVTVDNEPHVILIIRNITQQKEHQRQIAFMAYHDPLTRLPNRRYFYEKLPEAIHQAQLERHQLAVILIDLDNFKETNDRYGHEAGDEVLRHTARIIGEAAQSLGMGARLGGDEFVLFISPIPSVAFVQETIRDLEMKLSQTAIPFGNERLFVEMSIGASLFPGDGQDAGSLLNSADKAMYRTKRMRKEGLRI
ncbi:diguanylate cyclase [Paenibacillus filicis]|uniref:Diguanylate cyclase n=1 Tax=Paenibacillus filicis TaxID=669464 RepID=A0ABU9DQN3_9BACL